MRNMSKIAIINLKGGVGKSVTACNLACILAEKHSRRVLVMDLDKQANTTKFFLRPSGQDHGLRADAGQQA